MSFTDFITKYNGQKVDTDGAYGAQCMDLMHRYIVDVLGLPVSLFAAPTAYQAYLSANDARFQKIANTPTGVPQSGDIIFWNTSIGSAGHVAIFISGDVNHFVSLDQNWPVGSGVHRQDHDYKGVAGWLHFIGQPQSDPDYEQLYNACRVDRDSHWDDLQAANKQITQLKTQTQQLSTQVSDLTTKVEERERQLQSIVDFIEKIKATG